MRDLQFLGLHVVPVTNYDLKDIYRLDKVACAVARHLDAAGLLNWESWHESLEASGYRGSRVRLLRHLRLALPPSAR